MADFVHIEAPRGEEGLEVLLPRVLCGSARQRDRPLPELADSTIERAHRRARLDGGHGDEQQGGQLGAPMRAAPRHEIEKFCESG